MHCGPAGAGGRQLAAKIFHRFIHAGFELHVSVFKRGNGSHLRHDEILPSKMKTRIIKQRGASDFTSSLSWLSSLPLLRLRRSRTLSEAEGGSGSQALSPAWETRVEGSWFCFFRKGQRVHCRVEQSLP